MKDMKKEIKNPVRVDELSEFKAKLEKLLLKYPNLPEFTLTIRPRIDIKLRSSETFTWTSGNGGTTTLPIYTYAPTVIGDLPLTATTGSIIHPPTAPEQKSDKVDHPSKGLEASLSKKKIEEIEKMSKSGNGF